MPVPRSIPVADVLGEQHSSLSMAVLPLKYRGCNRFAVSTHGPVGQILNDPVRLAWMFKLSH